MARVLRRLYRLPIDPTWLYDRLAAAINALPVAEETLPTDLPRWDDLARMILLGWARGLTRDMRRAAVGLEEAERARGRAPDDEEVAAIEECFWRLASATDKFDAFVSLAAGAGPLRAKRGNPRKLEMRPDEDTNKARLRELGAPRAEEVVRARGAVNRGHAGTRRNQIAHSLAPLAALDDLALLVRIVHRDGRIMGNGYVLERWAPEGWNDGIKELTPEALFGRRLEEAAQGMSALKEAVVAFVELLETDGALFEPQRVYWDRDTNVYTLERPQSKRPPPRYEVEFVLRDDVSISRVVSCESEPVPGTLVPFDNGPWRVIRYDRLDDDRLDARAVCIRAET